MRTRPWLVLPLALLACDDPPATAPAAPAEPAEPAAPTAPATPPDPPAVASIDAPAAGRAIAFAPQWRDEHRWFAPARREVPAKLGRSELVTQVLLGEEGTDGILVTFYGRDLAPGEYRVLPATDETRREHAGRDSDVFTVVQTRPGEDDLRSESGTITIAGAEGNVAGSVDVVLRSRRHMVTAPLRARFDAAPDRQMDFALEQEAAIREQIRSKQL